MANTLLTTTAITRKALAILHQKLTFIGSINRQYDNSFAQSGAKIGDSLRIRLPNQYTVRSGATYSAQDTVETSTTLQVATQKGVDLDFTSVDLTLSLDEFAYRVLEPAMAVLAANIEADVVQNVTKDVFQNVNNIGSAATFAKLLSGRKALVDALAPAGDRNVLLNTTDNVDLVDALKGLFNDQASIGKQYREGVLGRTAGLDFAESTHLALQTRGTANGAYVTNGATQTGASIVVATGTGTIKKGEIITFAGVNRVHPETKVDTGVLQQFVVTADYAGGAGTISISPAIVASGAKQNVSNSIANGSAVTVLGTASTNYGQSLLYHKDAFAFATADLIIDASMIDKARETYDGISMRFVRGFDMTNDKVMNRLDVLYGYKTIRPELAVRLLNR